MQHTVSLTALPPQKDYVRACNGFSGMTVTPINDRSCKLAFIYCSDIGGWVPRKVIDLAMGSVMTSDILRFKRLAEKAAG
jgi:hypothetical protein